MARVIHRKKGVWEAVADEIITPSPDRITPADSHYISSAPWEILNLEKQKEYKVAIAQETYKKLGGIFGDVLNDISLVTDDVYTSYRNKIEFSFFEDESLQLHLAFRHRGTRIPFIVDDVSIASRDLMNTAHKILAWLRANKISRWDLKTLIVRSNRKGETIAGLFVTDPLFSVPEITPQELNTLGIHVYYSRKESPASVVDGVLFSSGQDYLHESLLGRELKYGIHSFFQVNIPVFEMFLKDVARFLPSTNSKFVDYYSGVGSISIPLSDSISSAELVDSNAQAIQFAQETIAKLGLNTFNAHAFEAEKLVEHITSDVVVMLDPPRAGLHENVVKRILEVKPALVLYLSCNLSTHARDLKLLNTEYEISHMSLYDFFPQTPHIEGFAVLRRKDG